MSRGATCSRDDAAAVTTCSHCGDFLCVACLREVEHSPLRYCADCLDRRAQHLAGRKLGSLHNNKPARVSVAFAILSVCGWFLPFFLVALPMAGWGMVRARELDGEGLATALLGLVLNSAHALLWVAVFYETFFDTVAAWL